MTVQYDKLEDLVEVRNKKSCRVIAIISGKGGLARQT